MIIKNDQFAGWSTCRNVWWKIWIRQLL